MPTLVVEWPQGEKTTFPVRGERVTIGRNQGNQIRINDSYVSGYHAEFRRSSEGHYEIVDLGSHNGTAVNGKQVKRTFVKEGDHLIIGLIEGRFLEGNDATKAATPPPRKMEPPRKTGTLDPSLELTQGIRPHHALAEAAQKLQRQVEAKAKADGGTEDKGETNLDVARDELSRVRAEIDEARKEAARLQKEQEETRAQLVQQRKTAAVPLTPAAQKGASGKLEEGRRIASQRDEELARAKEQRSSGVLPFMGGKESGVDREMAKLRSERLALQKENQGMAKRLAIVEGQAKEQERLAKELAATQAELAETKKKVVKESKAELERLQKETKRLESEAADAEKRKQDSTMVVDSEMKKAEGEIQKQKKAFEQEMAKKRQELALEQKKADEALLKVRGEESKAMQGLKGLQQKASSQKAEIQTLDQQLNQRKQELTAAEKAIAQAKKEREALDLESKEHRDLISGSEAKVRELEASVAKLKAQERSATDYLQMLNRQKRQAEAEA